MLKQITIATIHPDFIKAYLKFGPLAKAISLNLLKVNVINLRDFAVDKHGTVDGKPYGGDDGMVLRPEPLAEAIKSTSKAHVILTSPVGSQWNGKKAAKLKEEHEHLFFICGRFSGVDERIKTLYVDEEISCGDFVLSGGELPSLLYVDTLSRIIPGALGNDASSQRDSFSEAYDGLLEQALYTKPRIFEGLEVPPVLLSGDHKKIRAWEEEERYKETKKRRKDLLKKNGE